jgi:hypothetical protein
MQEQDSKERPLSDHGESGGSAGGAGATEAADRMRRELAAVADGGGSRDELQAAARALIGELRRRQLPAEQALVQLKEILAEAGLRPSYTAPANEPIGLHATAYRDIIAWSIRAYYDGDGR